VAAGIPGQLYLKEWIMGFCGGSGLFYLEVGVVGDSVGSILRGTRNYLNKF